MLIWRHGYSVRPQEVRAFRDASYTPEHNEALLDSTFAARAPAGPVVNAIYPIEKAADGVASGRSVPRSEGLFRESAPLAAATYARRGAVGVL